jgi:hypothetical protein
LKLTRLALLLGALILAGCAEQPPPAPVAQMPRAVGPARGIDLPTDSSDVLGELKGFPIDFVARYYRDPTSRWPALSPSEAQRLSSLGTKIVTVWEWHSSDPAYFTYAAGYNDALSAVRQAKTVGQPPGSAIYFAVDFNAHDAALYQVDQYFRGVNAGFAAAGGGRPEYKVGVYGSGAVCAMMKGEHLAQYSWLSGSTAWEGSSGYTDWNIRQAAQGARFANLSFSHDANEASSDYGGFQLANSTTPAGAVMAAATAVPVAAAALVGGAMAAVQPPPAAPAPAAPPIAAGAPTATAAVATAPTPPTEAPAPPTATTAVVAATPAAPAAVRVAPASQPPPNTSAAEVAALAAAEPMASPAQAEKPQSNPRSSEQSATAEAPPRERTAAHAAKEPGAQSRKTNGIAANTRAATVPLRRAGGSSLTESREAGRKASTVRRPQNHGDHLQAAKPVAAPALDRSVRRNVGQRRPDRVHHAEGT